MSKLSHIPHDDAVGHLAAATAYIIFGLNILSCRAITTDAHLSAMDLFTFRAAGAAALFWCASLFSPKESVEKRDFPAIFIASLLGLYLCQLAFLKAVSITTPFDCAVIASLTPIFTMLIAAVAVKEPITWQKAGGVALSFTGILLLIFNSTQTGGATATQPTGVVLMLANGLCFALYLGIFRPLILKYRVVTFMKWMFLFSALMSLPFSGPHLLEIDYAAMSPSIWMDIAFTVVGATFIAYFLIPVAQQRIRPTLVSMYSYLQPMIAASLGIWWGIDRLTWIKVLAAAAVFAGVAIVQKSRSRAV